ncbi:type II and III secretion system protein [Flavobacterium columnare NBRC 100251 = ATCC 23463]|uniref:Type II and III secretion system protein n=2 Tax=Flavobacterium TaxID=237 RepID=G8X4X9_FLACA|nr:secretin N-terminal domain-containing protein [Flavobacterium columnare]AEW86795.1 type II and III secretion system protein [Flavobacterium columnare ATCC 49512]ANO47217.1 type II and III secretion system protein [Flavobacterium columnare]APT22111.1 type II and III secretion system protein [Flavobacterium columnare]MBF6652895.1 type II and III secretion system protein [Flavobacterium columnare]MBF6656417.1 type II and III secretion system protein [Flavobacterium columnare]
MFKKIIYLLLGIVLSHTTYAQQDLNQLGYKFDELSKQKKGINEVLKINVSGLSLHDFIASIAEEHQLNIDVDTDLNQTVVNNFYDVTVKDVFLHLVQKYDLEISFLNNIIVFKKRKEIKIVEKKQPKIIDVNYNKENDFLSLKLENDSLPAVAKAIIDKSGKNVVLAPEIKGLKVSSYILNRPFDQVLQMMSKSNDLIVSKDENGFFFLEKNKELNSNSGNAYGTNTFSKNKQAKASRGALGYYDISLDKSGFLNVNADGADVNDILTEAAEKLRINYFLYNKPENEKASLSAEHITFDDLLDHVFKGRKYTFKKQDNLYLIGEYATEGLRSTEMIQLENRSIESVQQSLPRVFAEKLEIKEFVELNSLIVSGSKKAIDELRLYLKQIDKVVPMVQIEVIIAQYNKGYDIQTGFKAGLLGKGQTPIGTSGTLYPTADMSLNSTSINSLINAFNGFGLFKIGKVTESFYANLKLLENNSILKVESTPKIATISGHEAKLAIGETSYYFEQNNQILSNNIGNNILQSGTWKPTDANLSVSIKPFVSTDENVTLNIAVEKSSFLGRAGENAPPGKATQKFESLVRVKNGEMILLGGLDELKKENSGTGVPLISRIPILKWFTSSRKKSKSDAKLHIFIKPTVVY